MLEYNDSHLAESDDISLIRWMLTLTPQQHLAELESRVNFILSVRPDVTELSDHSEDVSAHKAQAARSVIALPKSSG
jgi:hypothetical protein